MSQTTAECSVTFDSEIPEEYPSRQLRSRRGFHPTIDPDGVFQFEMRHKESDYEKNGRSKPRSDADDTLHYSDGTSIDAGPRSSLDAEYDCPVTLHGFAGTEWFESTAWGHYYWRCLYNTHTGLLTIDKWNKNNRTVAFEAELPAERLPDPQLLVEEIAATTNPVETAELLVAFFEVDVNPDALDDIANSEGLHSIL